MTDIIIFMTYSMVILSYQHQAPDNYKQFCPSSAESQMTLDAPQEVLCDEFCGYIHQISSDLKYTYTCRVRLPSVVIFLRILQTVSTVTHSVASPFPTSLSYQEIEFMPTIGASPQPKNNGNLSLSPPSPCPSSSSLPPPSFLDSLHPPLFP